MVTPAYRMIRIKNASSIMKIIGFLYIFTIASLVGRTIAALEFNQMMGLFTPGLYQTLSFLALFLIMFVGNTGFVILLKEQVDQELLRVASFDDLTGILNRRTFVLLAKQIIAEHVKKQKHLSLVLFDIRYGGDEFAILLPEANEAESDRLVERFRLSAVQAGIPEIPATLSVSRGVVTIVPDQRTTLETLYNLCDRALYDAKGNGRNGAARTRIAL
ncbi:GGDEF domain-containing protein [Paenibacillus alkaliterrae]